MMYSSSLFTLIANYGRFISRSVKGKKSGDLVLLKHAWQWFRKNMGATGL